MPQILKNSRFVAYKIATKLLESPPGSLGKGAHSPVDCGFAQSGDGQGGSEWYNSAASSNSWRVT